MSSEGKGDTKTKQDRISRDISAAHYRLEHAIPMVGLWPKIETNHIIYWNYSRLKHALGGWAFYVVVRCSDGLAAGHYRLAHAVLMVGLWVTTKPNHIFYWNYTWLKHALGSRTLWVVARSGWSHPVPMTKPQHTTDWRTTDPMVGLWPSTLPNPFFYWNFLLEFLLEYWLKHALGGRTLSVVARCSIDLDAAHYWMTHNILMT